MSKTGFESILSTPIPTLGVTLEEYFHPLTGARHYHLDCQDDHNAFMVAFPTLPTDSSGVAHILEHTTLCGSQRYPVRDPFFMMLRRSLNTYMNAFTGGDSTAYPFATQNRKDFDNLLGVYLDAVFFPRLDRLDFAQEGWRIECADDGAESPLALHGVVYNEMKGAMSSPLSQLWQHVHTALFPQAVYVHNSGGDPLSIPDLSHQALTAFHATHYHPSNAVFMTYGSFPASEHQARITELALDRFDDQRDALVSPLQEYFTAAREVEVNYQFADSSQRATHIVWAWLLGESCDPQQVLAAHFLSSVLLEHSASPLRHYLESSTLANAPSELCGIDDSARQLAFFCGLEGTDPEHAQALEQGLFAVLEDVSRHGLAQPVLEALVDRLELAQRDVGGGSYPFGLQLMGRLLPAVMYRAQPSSLLDLDAALEELRGNIEDPEFLHRLVQELLLDNTHRVRVVMRPDATKAERDTASEHARLERIRDALSAQELEQIRADSQALRERQAQIDDDSILPRVTLADVPPAKPLTRPSSVSGDTDAISAYECATNGVFRVKLAAQLPALTPAELQVLPLWCEYLTELGYSREDYLQVQTRRALSGSFSVHALARPGPGESELAHAWLMISGTGLARKRDQVLAITQELIDGTRFDEHARLQELLQQSRAEAEESITDRGHHLAILSAARDLSPFAQLDELWEGPSSVQLLKQLGQERASRSDLEALFELFASIQKKIANAPRRFALIGEDSALSGASERCELGERASGDGIAIFVPEFESGDRPTSWLTSSQVNFCAKAYPAIHAASPDAPVLAVLGRYLQDGFLHREIREQGGAYGSGASFDSDGRTFRFFSYRDPRTIDTLNDFDRAVSWYAEAHDPQRLEESILGTIRSLDQPLSPAGEADRAFVYGLCGRDDSFRAEFRARVLKVTHDALVDVGQRYLRPELGSVGVITNPDNEASLRAFGLEPGRL
jgi:presequence protease